MTYIASQAAWYRVEHEKIGRNIEMAHGLKWEKCKHEVGSGGHFSIFLPFWGHFVTISGCGPFSFLLGQFYPFFSAFGPFSILYLAA